MIESNFYRIFRYVKALCVEWAHSPGGEPAMTKLMESHTYLKLGLIDMDVTHDVVYIKDFLDDFRIWEDIPNSTVTT